MRKKGTKQQQGKSGGTTDGEITAANEPPQPQKKSIN